MTIEKGEIHLYCILLDSTTVFFEKCKAALSQAELDRISFFKFPSVQNSFVISQGALRLILSEYLFIEAPKIQLAKHSKGKPFVMDDLNLRFNISNSGNYAVYAFSKGDEVGIDIEKIRLLPDLDNLIEKNFSLAERAFITKHNEEKQQRFFKFWTVKEAYLKAIGEGMRLAPDHLEFTVEIDNYKLDAVKGVFEQDDWLFKDFSFADDYVGTIAYKGLQTIFSRKNLVAAL